MDCATQRTDAANESIAADVRRCHPRCGKSLRPVDCVRHTPRRSRSHKATYRVDQRGSRQVEARVRHDGGLEMRQRVWFFQPRTEAKANYSNGAGKEQTWTPWFACYLASAARALGLTPHLIDARVDSDWLATVRTLGPEDILAVSVMTGAAITDSIKASTVARDNGSYVVWGGPHVTLFPAQTLEQSPADAVIPGFGYAGLSLLLHRLTGVPMPHTASAPVVLAKGEEPPTSSMFNILRQSPNRDAGGLVAAPDNLPDLDLISNWEPYVNPDLAIAPRTLNYVTSEGCLRRCTFCSEPQTSGNSWYVRRVELAIDRIREMVGRASASGLKLHDPNFFHDGERAQLFGDLLAEQVGIPWAASLHPADLTDMSDGALSAAADSGLCRVLMGLETPVPELVKLAGKRYDPSRIPEMATRLARVGVRGMFTFIVGWPGAAPDHYQQTIDAAYRIRELWSEHQCKIHFLEPWPGTPIYTMLRRKGFPYPDSLEEWARVDYYQAQYAELHDSRYTDIIRQANSELSPYVDA
ncbi:radical SAM protein [Micromonospora sp. NPDC049523]|uniref:B12-binding domain-containing radical SAM protein n=1 Tax=Micromonospora sp. NPDC049523 TaxID=3155921 RepID=UPI0034157767